jgi:hypothetical protein
VAARDAWMSWDHPAHGDHLERVLNDARFLILP